MDICSTVLRKLINSAIKGCVFPNKLKVADITPIFKKGNATDVKNYRPISVLPPISKIFEKLLYMQMSTYFEQFLSPYLCGYRKGFSTQEALLTLIEKWKKSLDKGGYSGAILKELSKAFDTIDHELLLAKLHTYGFDRNSLLLVKSYLSKGWQRTNNNSFSSWTELLQGVPQGSVWGPLLFNIYTLLSRI